MHADLLLLRLCQGNLHGAATPGLGRERTEASAAPEGFAVGVALCSARSSSGAVRWMCDTLLPAGLSCCPLSGAGGFGWEGVWLLGSSAAVVSGRNNFFSFFLFPFLCAEEGRSCPPHPGRAGSAGGAGECSPWPWALWRSLGGVGLSHEEETLWARTGSKVAELSTEHTQPLWRALTLCSSVLCCSRAE